MTPDSLPSPPAAGSASRRALHGQETCGASAAAAVGACGSSRGRECHLKSDVSILSHPRAPQMFGSLTDNYVLNKSLVWDRILKSLFTICLPTTVLAFAHLPRPVLYGGASRGATGGCLSTGASTCVVSGLYSSRAYLLRGNILHTRNQHLKNNSGFPVAFSNGLSVACSNIIPFFSGIFTGIV